VAARLGVAGGRVEENGALTSSDPDVGALAVRESDPGEAGPDCLPRSAAACPEPDSAVAGHSKLSAGGW
jgi:hypothetical protein